MLSTLFIYHTLSDPQKVIELHSQHRNQIKSVMLCVPLHLQEKFGPDQSSSHVTDHCHDHESPHHQLPTEIFQLAGCSQTP